MIWKIADFAKAGRGSGGTRKMRNEAGMTERCPKDVCERSIIKVVLVITRNSGFDFLASVKEYGFEKVFVRNMANERVQRTGTFVNGQEKCMLRNFLKENSLASAKENFFVKVCILKRNLLSMEHAKSFAFQSFGEFVREYRS